jgi:hypothetical protein
MQGGSLCVSHATLWKCIVGAKILGETHKSDPTCTGDVIV